ncbi:hypothetical protein GCM10022222_82500 [Amycolatopsis ultiminotia]|uniref:Uncharacterized protein n=1 Tax=Amycolatopsis ultiminotia TaxID=543629 RepID=A0ABP6YKG1_9PSEU
MTDTVDVVVRCSVGGRLVTVVGGGAASVTVTVAGCAGGDVLVGGVETGADRGPLPATRSAATSRPPANPASPVTTTYPQVGAVFDIRHLLAVPPAGYEDHFVLIISFVTDSAS